MFSLSSTAFWLNSTSKYIGSEPWPRSFRSSMQRDSCQWWCIEVMADDRWHWLVFFSEWGRNGAGFVHGRARTKECEDTMVCHAMSAQEALVMFWKICACVLCTVYCVQNGYVCTYCPVCIWICLMYLNLHHSLHLSVSVYVCVGSVGIMHDVWYMSQSVFCIHVCIMYDVCMNASLCMCVYVCMHTCMHACMYVYVCVCMYVCLHVCMCVCVYVCMYACTYAPVLVCHVCSMYYTYIMHALCEACLVAFHVFYLMCMQWGNGFMHVCFVCVFKKPCIP